MVVVPDAREYMVGAAGVRGHAENHPLESSAARRRSLRRRASRCKALEGQPQPQSLAQCQQSRPQAPTAVLPQSRTSSSCLAGQSRRPSSHSGSAGKTVGGPRALANRPQQLAARQRGVRVKDHHILGVSLLAQPRGEQFSRQLPQVGTGGDHRRCRPTSRTTAFSGRSAHSGAL